MESNLKKGDVVRLKSGGPDMTIQVMDYIETPERRPYRAKCIWFEGSQLKHQLFGIALLELVKKSE